jgi:hypothetical protein
MVSALSAGPVAAEVERAFGADPNAPSELRGSAPRQNVLDRGSA